MNKNNVVIPLPKHNHNDKANGSVKPASLKTQTPDGVSDIFVDSESDSRKLDKLMQQTSEILYKAKSSRLFQLLPDEIVVDKNKVDIIYKHFPIEEDRYTMLIRDIKYVGVHMDWLFASLYFEIRGHESNPPTIYHLKKNEAIEARRIIIGLIAAQQERVDISNINDDDLKYKLKEIGKNIDDS